MTLFVQSLWRYPVKSMAGEQLEHAEITADGIVGDRLVHVRGPEGVRTARRQHRPARPPRSPRVRRRAPGRRPALDRPDRDAARPRGRWRRDPEVLRDIVRRFGGKLALNADIVRPGAVRVGDPVRLVTEPARP